MKASAQVTLAIGSVAVIAFLGYTFTDESDDIVNRHGPPQGYDEGGVSKPAVVTPFERNQAASTGREEALPTFSTTEHSTTEAPSRVLMRSQRQGVFEAEPVDPDWAPRVEALIYSQIIDSGMTLAGLDVECRSFTCKLTLRHFAPARSTEELAPRLAEVRTMTSQMLRAGSADVKSVHIQGNVDPNELGATVVYVSREGSQSSIDMRVAPQAIPNAPCFSTETCADWRPSWDDSELTTID